ncbi:unnamed protein product [Arctia plantaginis]|uniref:Uncharacterized protein n=1 Tax=Arctia plantaginis TaxID=874455 RepID=A0A8S1BHS9_ARCPL|nr:unnamed protein product [Arctia plantaginis]
MHSLWASVTECYQMTPRRNRVSAVSLPRESATCVATAQRRGGGRCPPLPAPHRIAVLRPPRLKVLPTDQHSALDARAKRTP